MTIQIQTVQPGDLITAALFNDMLEELAAIDARVAALEGAVPTPSSAVVISALDKTTLHVGEDIRISGQNFGFALGAHRVRFNGVAPTAVRAGSSDTLLICQVPPIPALPAAGGQVNLTVSNVTLAGPGASATRTITVLPAQVPQAGNIDVVFEDATPDPLTAGTNNEFEFTISSDASQQAQVTLTPVVSVGSPPASWSTAVLDDNHNTIADRRITLAPGTQETVFIRVSIPANTNGTAFTLALEGSAPGLPTASSGALSFTVGQDADPDATITLSPSPSPGVAGSKITASTGQMRDVSVEASFTVAGTYDVSLTPVAGTTNWTIALLDPPANAPQVPITQGDLGASGTAAHTIQFRVRPNANASDPGQLRLTVQRSGQAKSRSFTFDLDVA